MRYKMPLLGSRWLRTVAASSAFLVLLVVPATPSGTPGLAASTPFVWPLSGTSTPDQINSPFGPRLRASTGSTYEFHEGIDLAAPVGTPVHAVLAGRVRLLTDDAGCRITVANTTARPGCTPIYPNGGRIVQLDHGRALYSNYLHLSRQSARLRVGASVSTGDVIGAVGMTGTTSFSHLHFEVRAGSLYSKDAKNPLGYLPRRHNVAPVVAATAQTSVGGIPAVSVTVTTAPDDVDLNEVTLHIYDKRRVEVDRRTVQFNQRVNCGTNNPEVNHVLLKPDAFNRHSTIYRLTVVFKGVSVPTGGSYRAVAVDATGLSSSASESGSSGSGTTHPMYVTLYGWADNSPPGPDIAYPVLHARAGGTGTYTDPVTFATDQKELAPGTIVYYPYLKKYFVMEDDCGDCDKDWEGKGPNGGPGYRHIDLWAGGDANSTNPRNPEGAALRACENALTQAGQVPVIVNPPNTLQVDTTPIFDTRTNQCYHP